METGDFETRNLTTIHDTPQSTTAFWEQINAEVNPLRHRSLEVPANSIYEYSALKALEFDLYA